MLFPNVFLPLHIFEPRYREMVADAIDSDRMIGMVLLKAGWEHEYDGSPAVYPIGCSSVITHVERLDDGRYNIVLRGVERFRILEENHERRYRRALIEPLVERTLARRRTAPPCGISAPGSRSCSRRPSTATWASRRPPAPTRRRPVPIR